MRDENEGEIVNLRVSRLMHGRGVRMANCIVGADILRKRDVSEIVRQCAAH